MQKNTMMALLFLGVCIALTVLAVNAKANAWEYENSFKRSVAQHIVDLEEAQARQDNLTIAMTGAFGGLDDRLAAVEARPAQVIERLGSAHYCVAQGHLNDSGVVLDCKPFS